MPAQTYEQKAGKIAAWCGLAWCALLLMLTFCVPCAQALEGTDDEAALAAQAQAAEEYLRAIQAGEADGAAAATSMSVQSVPLDVFSGTATASSVEISPLGFTARTTRPAASNANYYSAVNPYYRYDSLAPTGNPCYGSYVTGNCTWYAWGRAREILGSDPQIGCGDPYDMWECVQSNGAYQTGQEPRVGSLCIGSSGDSWHVSVVEAIVDGVAYVSESGYSVSSTAPTADTITFHYGPVTSWMSGGIVGYIYLLDDVDHNPSACADHIEGGRGQVHVSGWAYDVDEPSSSLAIHVYVGGPAGSGASGFALSTDCQRDDVNSAFGISGTHGFDATLDVGVTGQQEVYVYAINVGQGVNVLIDHKTVNVGRAFSDVRDSHAWYYQSVYAAADAGLLAGYDSGAFGPGDALTRAQAAVILWRYLDGTGSTAGQAALPDIETNQYYTTAANWAVSHGVINGKDVNGQRLFDPQGAITRQELCAILANAAVVYKGASPDSASLDVLSKYPDAGQISSWAQSSVTWALGTGLVSGVDQSGTRYVAPTEPVNRAMMAAILMKAVNAGVLK